MSDYNSIFDRSKKISLSIVLVLIISCIGFYSIIMNWKIDCEHSEKIINIPKGASATAVAEILKEDFCLENIGLFKLALAMSMNDRNIRSGRYDLKGVTTIGQLVKLITSFSADRVKVTLVEGWTIKQFAHELSNNLQIDSLEFIRLSNNNNFIHAQNIDASSLEGFLFPDTYIFLKTYTEEEVLKVIVNQYKHNENQLMQNINPDITLDMFEITTLASIIQGEAVYDDEMPIISSVYHNRLSSGMLLQADPTIQYIVPGKPRRLYNKDLGIDSPYNTYKYKGLPPGPINNPGLSALKAAMDPADTDYLYFVSNGEGRHIFTRTVEEHNQAKLKLKRKRRLRKKM